MKSISYNEKDRKSYFEAYFQFTDSVKMINMIIGLHQSTWNFIVLVLKDTLWWIAGIVILQPEIRLKFNSGLNFALLTLKY